jgi:hypothetical protein
VLLTRIAARGTLQKVNLMMGDHMVKHWTDLLELPEFDAKQEQAEANGEQFALTKADLTKHDMWEDLVVDALDDGLVGAVLLLAELGCDDKEITEYIIEYNKEPEESLMLKFQQWSTH